MPSPISVQSQKLIPWLVERRVISKDYMKSLEYISKKINDFNESSADKIEVVEVKPVQYFYALDVLKHLENTDNKKDFFGRDSASIRAWRDIVSRYESEHINLAEISERLNDLCYQLPKCKSSIADRQKLINDLQKKIAELTANQHSKETELTRFCNQFDIKDDRARLQLLEKAANLPSTLREYVDGLKYLAPVVGFYLAYTNFLNPENMSTHHACPTLRLLINSGNVTVYEWRTGHAPSSIGESDDRIPKMIEMERKEIEALEADFAEDSQEINFADLDLVGETDLGEIDFGTDFLDEIHIIDVSNDLSTNAKEEKDNSSTIEGKGQSTLGKSASVATGSDARLLLDSTDGRNALINDLEELSTFLIRVRENLVEFQGADFNLPEAKSTKKKVGGLNTDSVAPIYHQIMLDAPEEIRSKSPDDIDLMSAAVQKAFNEITNEAITHMSLLRLQPSYLERLIGIMQNLRQQANRSKSRAVELAATVEQANEELTKLQMEMNECLQERRQLVSYLEKELSRLYDRDIKLIGAAIAM
nr:cdk5 regulatory subunit associated protein 3 [Hymenolepis microstoma]